MDITKLSMELKLSMLITIQIISFKLIHLSQIILILKKSFSSKMTYNGQVMITFVKLEPKTTWFCITLLRWPITISQRNLITQPARFYTLTCHKIRIWGQCARIPTFFTGTLVKVPVSFVGYYQDELAFLKNIFLELGIFGAV